MTLTREEAEESREMESLRTHADALLSLSSPASSAPATATATTAVGRRALAAEGVFECKTCSKRFPSFQALGGHRTSHTRLQARMLQHEPAAGGAGERDRARVHECAVCGLEFSMGQALGGHMRRHRGEPPPASGAATADGEQPESTMPDLNYPPLLGGGGGGDDDDTQESSADHGSEPQLLNLLV